MISDGETRTTSEPTRAERPPYRPEIDGLRAIAVAAVIGFHAHFTLLGKPVLAGGYLGVDVFFVISGYLIASLNLGALDRKSFSLLAFYNRRARRILPALFVVLAASFIVAVVILTPRLLVDFSKSLAACVFFVGNIFFWWRTDYFAEPGELTPLLHLWSLSVEEQFYLVFPLVLLLLWTHARRMIAPLLVVAGAASLFLALRISATNPAAVFYLFPFKAWELLAGATLARIEQRYGRRLPSSLAAAVSIFGLLLIVVSFVFLGTRSAIGSGSILAVTGTALVILGGHGPAFWLLSRKPLVHIGLISYSLYLWHQPLFAFARLYALNAPGQPTFMLLALVSVVMAELSWRHVEQPFRKRSFSGRQFAAFAMVTCLVLVTAALAAIVSAGLPFRYSREQQVLLQLNPERGAISMDGRPCTRRSIADACIIGKPGVAPSFAVLGDSHAETLTGPLDDYFKRKSISAYVYTNAGCPFIVNVVDRAAANECYRFTDEAIAALRAHNISRVVVNDRSTAYILGTRFDNTEGGVEPGAPFPVEPLAFSGNESQRIAAVADEWRNTMRRLIDDGVTIYDVLPVPEVGWHVPRTLVKLIAQRRLPLTTSLSVYLERNKLVLDMARDLSSNKQFVPIYPHEVFCSSSSGRCATHEGNEIFYTDTDHLSREGAERLVGAIAREIDARQ